MKKIINKYHYYIIVSVFFLSVTACNKQLNLNSDSPNGVTPAQISGSGVFANALQTTSTNITNSYAFANEWMGVWARTSSYSPSGQQEVENFDVLNDLGNGIWQSEYANIYNYNFIISHSSSGSILPGASAVMKAMIFQDLVDVFGNVPYTQGGLGNIPKPKYDTAQTIYESLISDIDAAITSIKSSKHTVDDTADIMFQGDPTKWVQFANTLKLRILLRLVPNGDQNFVKTAFANIAAEGTGFLIAGEDASINPGYTNVTGKQSPFYSGYGFDPTGAVVFGHVFYIANETLISTLDSLSDPRLSYLYTYSSATPDGNYLGSTPYGVGSLASIGTGVLQSASQNAVIMLAAQSYFLQAEAAYRGLISGSYSTLLQTGIEESFRYLTVPNPVATADAYYTSATSDEVNPSVGSNPLKAIIYQKWIALSEIDGLETWSEYRRTGFPYRINPSQAAGITPATNVLPKKLLYPETEYQYNGANVNAQGQGPTDYTVKIFWGQ
jgi:hypothetical protein